LRVGQWSPSCRRLMRFGLSHKKLWVEPLVPGVFLDFPIKIKHFRQAEIFALQ